jgi:HPt (histidine-containing phosphotransfer) domain-containing protein
MPATLSDEIYSLLARDPDVQDLVAEFVAAMGQRVAALAAAAEDRDWREVTRRAHQLKGAAGSYGFIEVTPYAARVEQLAKEAAGEKDIFAALAALQDICSRLRARPADDARI